MAIKIDIIQTGSVRIRNAQVTQSPGNVMLRRLRFPGHVSLIVFDDDVTYFLAGDAAYILKLLDKELLDGINTDPQSALDSMKKMKEFCRGRDMVMLPSHEFDAERRLNEKEVYKPSRP